MSWGQAGEDTNSKARSSTMILQAMGSQSREVSEQRRERLRAERQEFKLSA